MKLDDRDIVCEQDYTPLSNAELVTQIEENLEWLRGASLFDTERVMGPVRALLARAEAAEARVADLEAALVGMDGHMARLISERNDALDRAEAAEALAYERLEAALFAEQRATDADIRAEETDADASRLRLELAAAKLGISALAARVAELESQLAEQQWRPVTEEWPPCGLRVVISALGATWAEVARKHFDGDEHVWELETGHAFDFESATVALPLPQEPPQ